MTSKQGCQKKFCCLFWLLLCCLAFNKPLFAASAYWQHPDTYVGFYSGIGFGYNQASTNVGSVTGASYFTSAADITAINNAGTSIKTPSTLIGGVQAGHDWVYKKMVYGAVLDYGAMSLNASNTKNNVGYSSGSDQYSIHTSAATNWLLTLRGRLGFRAKLHWPSLLYVTGGIAATRFEINNTFTDNAALQGAGNVNNNPYEIGFAVGIGIDIAALKKLILNVEYLLVDMPSVVTTTSISNSADSFGTPAGSQSSPFTVTDQFHAHLLKIGLNYRFNQ